jgi:hypothetical protein
MAHGVVRTDKLFGADNRTGIVSAKYYVSTTATDVDNGNVLAIDSLISGEREVYKAVTPAADTAIEKIILVATPEVNYVTTEYPIEKCYNKAGKELRGYHLTHNAIFSVTADALSAASTITVGNVVELQAGTKLKVVASGTASTTQVGKIIAIETVGRFTYYVIQVD